jgi:hypothetical protein
VKSVTVYHYSLKDLERCLRRSHNLDWVNTPQKIKQGEKQAIGHLLDNNQKLFLWL